MIYFKIVKLDDLPCIYIHINIKLLYLIIIKLLSVHNGRLIFALINFSSFTCTYTVFHFPFISNFLLLY